MGGEIPVALLHWCYYSLGLSLGLLEGFGWNGLQTMVPETAVLLNCDLSGYCSSPGVVWGLDIRLDAHFVPSTLHCTCSLSRAQCVYRNNLHVLWTDWKQSPVHSIGTGPAAENIQSSERDNNREKTQYEDLIKFLVRVINWERKRNSEIPGEHQHDSSQSSNHICM